MKIVWLLLLVALSVSGCGSKTKENLYEEGVKQLKASNPAGAVVYFKNALEKDANYYDARLQLAKAYAALGKNEQAEKEYLKVLTQSPEHDEVLLELARLYITMSKGDQAYAMGQKYLARHPGSAEGLEAVGGAFAAQGKYREAVEHLERALAADPHRSTSRIQLASVQVVVGHTDRARELLSRVIADEPKNFKALFMLASLEKDTGHADKAAALYRKVLELDPGRLDAQYKLGMIDVEQKHLDRAEKAADQMIKQNPKRGEGYRLKGVVSYHRRNYVDAITALQQSIKLAPSLDGYQFLGLSYYGNGELESALSQFRIILDRIPNSRQARLLTAQVLLSQKRVDDAVAEIKKVLAADDSDAVAHNLLGTAYIQQGLFEEGMHELDLATKLDPKLVQAHLKKGAYYFREGKTSRGEEELASAVSASPDSLSSRLLLATFYHRQGNTDKALSLLRAGLRGGKQDAPIYNAMAGLQIARRDRNGAAKSLADAKRVDPFFAAAYLNLAGYYAAQADYAKAIAELSALHQKVPGNLRALFGLATLSELAGRDNDALAYYQKAKQTGAPEAYLALAAYHQKKGATGKALEVLDEAIRLDPRAAAPLDAKGRLFLAQRDYKKALKAAEEMETLDPDRGISLKIKVYVAMKEGAKAVEQAQRLIARYPTSTQGYLVLANVYQMTGDIPRALAQVQRAVKANPKSAEPRLMLGDLNIARKDFPAAQAAFQEALRLQPDSAAAKFALANLVETQGKKEDAVARYRAIVQQHGSFAPALNNLAYLCADGYGSKEEALRYAFAAYRLEPGNAVIIDTVGYALIRSGRNADAVKVLERAATLAPANPTVRYHLALAYRQTGDLARSQKELQESLAMGEYPDRKAAQALLAQLRK